MNELFVTADTHINHYAIVLHTRRTQFIKPNPNFDPTKPKHMRHNWPEIVELDAHNDFMINNWNSAVSKKDTVIIVGDYIWNNHMHYFHRMNGKKILVIGNHDKQGPVYLNNFTETYDRYVKIFNKSQVVVFEHYPMLSWPSSCYGSWNIHGHCHGRLQERDDSLRCDVGVDVWNYSPIPWEILNKKMSIRLEKWRERRRQKDLEECIEDHVCTNKQNNLNLFGTETGIQEQT